MDAKSAILIIVVVVLIAAGGYLVFLIQDGSSPLVLFDSQASEDDPLLDEDPLLAQAGSSPSPSPSPTIPYQSTSPTVTPTTSAAVSATPTIDLLMSPTAGPTELPETGGIVVTATPTPVTNLPVAGVFDYVPAVAGGILLVVVAMLL